jgi:long-chain acyl-CoA synthetase
MAQPSDPYEQRPWLGEYRSYVPAELSLPFESGLAMFRHTAAAHPDQPAIYYFERPLTYAEVDRQSDALAAALIAQGIRRGDRVAMYCQNVPQFIIGQYAIWKAGAIMVLCNPMFKQRELDYHLTDSGASALICQEALWESVAKETVPVTQVRTVITTSELDYLPGGGEAAPVPTVLRSAHKLACEGTLDWLALLRQFDGQRVADPGLTPDDVAYLTYTSGTTGRPKGAMNTHRNVVYNADVYRTWMQLTSDDVVIGMAPFFHITGLIAHLAVAALAGMPIITFYRMDASECLRLIERWKGTFTVASITAFIALMDSPDIQTRDLSSLRKAYSGGAPIAPNIVERFEQLTGSYIHNVYGLTETTSPSHAVPMGSRAPVDSASGALSIGVPIPGSISKIVDLESGEPLPVGEIGELITRGPEIVAGYWQKPEETRQAIRDGYLFTGDVARMDERGYFYIVDRKKDMIIASGFKVWPREVEDVLYQHPAVREAAVIGVPDAYRGESVKAFVSLKRDYEGQVTPDELIDFCRQQMAAYKYPRAVEILPEIPKTLTGKFLRRELRDRELQTSTSQTSGGGGAGDNEAGGESRGGE